MSYPARVGNESAFEAATQLAALVSSGFSSRSLDSGMLVAPYICADGLAQQLVESDLSPYVAELAARFNETDLIRVRKWVRGDRRREGRSVDGYLVIKQAAPLTRVVTGEGCIIGAHGFWDFTDHCVSRLFDRLYPLATPARISSEALVRVLAGCEDAGWAVRIYRVRMRPRGGGSDTSRRPLGPEMSLDNLTERAELLGADIDKVDFLLSNQNGSLCLKAFLSREGFAKYYAGRPDLFARLVVDPIEAEALCNWDLLERVEAAASELRLVPVQIEFGKPQLRSAKDNKRLMGIFSHDAQYVLSVQHWNPYFRANVVDYLDGSRFTIAAGRQDVLLVVPGPGASTASLHKVCHKVTSEFAEGRIQERPELEVRLAVS